MPRTPNYRTADSVAFTFPPIRGMVKWLMIVNLGIFVLYELISLADPEKARWAALHFALNPEMVVRHGAIWQLVTYGFFHLGVMSILWNLLALWFLGYMVEGIFGRRFLQYYLICVAGGAIGVIAIAYSGASRLAPSEVQIGGANAAMYGLLIAIALIMPEAEFLLFFFIRIKAKYLVAIILVVAVLMSLSAPGAVIYFGEFGGLIAGFVYIKVWGRQSVLRSAASVPYRGRGLSDRAYEAPAAPRKPFFLLQWRDAYYRWKRRRAARKFEVYMRKHDRQVYFDEHGNYIDPESAEARQRGEDDSKKPWVN